MCNASHVTFVVVSACSARLAHNRPPNSECGAEGCQRDWPAMVFNATQCNTIQHSTTQSNTITTSGRVVSMLEGSRRSKSIVTNGKVVSSIHPHLRRTASDRRSE
ncbi:hypothetical protein BU25DRAFT_166546 [Macroventuria anomochaeta]|uniref:Uncharacterized protein n=1 Tax=Macroventuria anomochaeta TaxID=301207 RepID=A0ACB6RQJ2_9PLEO|nr:uncharacterized protein BU25DRAFT_166546 [Macroventuria anomochaeta]KAF2624078.1 hypothetical protein BU25DRAFT_166546 [Macroventuria anomochaeta]